MRQGWARVVTIPGVLLGLAMVWWALPGGPRLQIVEISGTAQLDRVGLDRHLPARVGAPLQAADTVRTGDASEAVLQFGADTLIRVGPTSSVEVASVDDEGLSLELEEGSLRAIVRPDDGQVRIGNQGRTAVAMNATVDVGVRDDILQIRAVEGDVSLDGVDRASLAEGEAATILDRRARVGPVPSSLLLSVVPPTVTRTAAAVEIVEGRTEPGADVVANGPVTTEQVRADAQGRFRVPVRLTEGANTVTVQATDLFGTEVREVVPLPDRDTTGPVVQGGVEYPQ